MQIVGHVSLKAGQTQRRQQTSLSVNSIDNRKVYYEYKLGRSITMERLEKLVEE